MLLPHGQVIVIKMFVHLEDKVDQIISVFLHYIIFFSHMYDQLFIHIVLCRWKMSCFVSK